MVWETGAARAPPGHHVSAHTAPTTTARTISNLLFMASALTRWLLLPPVLLLQLLPLLLGLRLLGLDLLQFPFSVRVGVLPWLQHHFGRHRVVRGDRPAARIAGSGRPPHRFGNWILDVLQHPPFPEGFALAQGHPLHCGHHLV